MRNLDKTNRIIKSAQLRAINKILRTNYNLRINYSNNRRVIFKVSSEDSDEFVGVTNDWQLLDMLQDSSIIRRTPEHKNNGWEPGVPAYNISDEDIKAIAHLLMLSKLSS